jgi:hypothetical protein
MSVAGGGPFSSTWTPKAALWECRRKQLVFAYEVSHGVRFPDRATVLGRGSAAVVGRVSRVLKEEQRVVTRVSGRIVDGHHAKGQ